MAQKGEEQKQHGIRYGEYILVWLGLISLTCLTVALASIDLGRWVIITALTIASVKSMMVLNTFMHLKNEDRVFRIFVAIALTTLIIFITFTFFDYAFT
jgi:cytochrome c oxidase subunit IV